MSIPRSTVEQRKAMPLASGVLDYFPDALLVVAEVSRVGNEQHHPGEPLHWDKSKSSDEADALLRHLLDRGTLDTDGLRHTGKVAWRALALLQRELDAEAAAESVDLLGSEWVERPERSDETVKAWLDALGRGQMSVVSVLERMDSIPTEERRAVRVEPEVVDSQSGPVAVVSEPWGTGDGLVYGVPRDSWAAYGRTERELVAHPAPLHLGPCSSTCKVGMYGRNEARPFA